MGVNLETLELVPQEVEFARERVRALAYEKWQQAGCPDNELERMWLLAESDWIAHEYIPHREDSRDEVSRNRSIMNGV